MKISEENFISRMKLKDETALRYAIKQYGGLVKAVVRKHLFQDARRMFFEECINDVFLSVWNNIDSYEPEKNSVKNWIAAIARFKAIDYGRKYAVIRRHESEEDVDNVMVISADMTKETDSDMSEQLQWFLRQLSESDRELFWRVYVAEDSVAEISRDTGMKPSVIYNHLSRGRRKLKKLYTLKKEGR